MREHTKGRTPLVNSVNPRKLSPAVLKEAQQLVAEHRDDYLQKQKGSRSVQLDDQTYQLLRRLKKTYGVYIYDIIKESVLFMSLVLSNKQVN